MPNASSMTLHLPMQIVPNDDTNELILCQGNRHQVELICLQWVIAYPRRRQRAQAFTTYSLVQPFHLRRHITHTSSSPHRPILAPEAPVGGPNGPWLLAHRGFGPWLAACCQGMVGADAPARVSYGCSVTTRLHAAQLCTNTHRATPAPL